MRKAEKIELIKLLEMVRSRFRPAEFDKMTLGDWKELDVRLSKTIVKLGRELDGSN